MNKLKFILTASIAALLTLSCGMLEEEDSNSSSSGTTPSSSSGGTSKSSSSVPGGGGRSSSGGNELFDGFERVQEVELGGTTATIGSSLDIDATPFKVYKISELTGNKEKIDLVFDGTKVWTAATIGEASAGSLSTAFAGINNYVCLFEVPSSTKTVEDLENAYEAAESCVENVSITAGLKFGVRTSEENYALVVVNSNTAQILTIKVGRITEEYSCETHPGYCGEGGDDECDFLLENCYYGDDPDYYCTYYDMYCGEGGGDYDYCEEYPYDPDCNGPSYCHDLLGACDTGNYPNACDIYYTWCETPDYLGKAAAKPLLKLKAKAKIKAEAKAKNKVKIKKLFKKKK